MTQQATRIEPKLKLRMLTLSRETIAALAGTEPVEVNRPRATRGEMCTFTCKHSCNNVCH